MTRISDGKLVYIKEVRTGDLESSIASMLSSIDDAANHSLHILDTFEDSVNKSTSYFGHALLALGRQSVRVSSLCTHVVLRIGSSFILL